MADYTPMAELNKLIAELGPDPEDEPYRLKVKPTMNYVGVTQLNSGKFCAKITIDGKTRYLGVFNTAVEAAEKYKIYREKHPLTNGRAEFVRRNYEQTV